MELQKWIISTSKTAMEVILHFQLINLFHPYLQTKQNVGLGWTEWTSPSCIFSTPAFFRSRLRMAISTSFGCQKPDRVNRGVGSESPRFREPSLSTMGP